jgi:hypothetical protein
VINKKKYKIIVDFRKFRSLTSVNDCTGLAGNFFRILAQANIGIFSDFVFMKIQNWLVNSQKQFFLSFEFMKISLEDKTD